MNFKEIIKKAKKNARVRNYYYINEDCSNLTKSFIHIITVEYGIRHWSDLFEAIKEYTGFTIDPKKSELKNLDYFLFKYNHNNILNNE